ncbi:MAG: adenine phosphoribosyltransferase [Candidatus Glassbacteria bacterium]
MNLDKLRHAIRDVPDFPKKGIVFKDITTLLKEPDLCKEAVELLAERYRGKEVRKIVGIESRGFIFASAIAYTLGAGFIPVRKPGKLPAETLKEVYELEYGTDSVEIHRDAVSRGEKVAVIDDLLATGGTMAATLRLLDKLGAEVIGISFLIELEFLKGREKLAGYDVYSLITY